MKDNVGTFNIVERVLKDIAPERRENLLKRAIADQLYRAVATHSDPDEALRQLFHKAQSFMDAETSLKFSDEVLENFGIDARRTERRMGPRTTVEHFMAGCRNRHPRRKY